jgi:hypothetical protein
MGILHTVALQNIELLESITSVGNTQYSMLQLMRNVAHLQSSVSDAVAMLHYFAA